MFTLKGKPNEKKEKPNFIDAVAAACAVTSKKIPEKEITLLYPKSLGPLSNSNNYSDTNQFERQSQQSQVQDIEFPTDSTTISIVPEQRFCRTNSKGKCKCGSDSLTISETGSPFSSSALSFGRPTSKCHRSFEINPLNEGIDVTDDDSLSEDPENQTYYDAHGNLLKNVGNPCQGESIDEGIAFRKRKNRISSTIFRNIPPSKEEFYEIWKNVRNAPEEFGMSSVVMCRDSFEDFYNYYTKTSAFNQSSNSGLTSKGNVCNESYITRNSTDININGININDINISDIPHNPIRGYEHFFHWKPVIDPQVLKRQKSQYRAYKAKHPHLPTLTSEDFKFNPATVQRYMRHAKQWDAIVTQEQTDLLKGKQWTNHARFGFPKTPAVLSSRMPFLKEGVYQGEGTSRRYPNAYPGAAPMNSNCNNNNPLEPLEQSESDHSGGTHDLSLNQKQKRFNNEFNFLKAAPLAPGRCPSPIKQSGFNFTGSFEKAKVKVKNAMIRSRYQAQFERIMFRKRPHEIFRMLAPRTDYENLDISPDNKYGLKL